MAPLCYAAKFDPLLSLDCARVEGEAGSAIQGKEGIKFCSVLSVDIWPPCYKDLGAHVRDGGGCQGGKGTSRKMKEEGNDSREM